MLNEFLYKPLDGIPDEANQVESDHFLQIYAAQSTLLNILGWFYKSYKFGVTQTIENLYDRDFYEKSGRVMQNFHKKLKLGSHCDISASTIEKMEARFIIHSVSTLYNLIVVDRLISEGYTLNQIMFFIHGKKIEAIINVEKIELKFCETPPFYTYNIGEYNHEMKNKLLKFAQGLFQMEHENNTLIISNLINTIPESIKIYSDEFLSIVDNPASIGNFKSQISGVVFDIYERIVRSLFKDMIKSDEDVITGIYILTNIINGLDPAVRHLIS